MWPRLTSCGNTSNSKATATQLAGATGELRAAEARFGGRGKVGPQINLVMAKVNLDIVNAGNREEVEWTDCAGHRGPAWAKLKTGEEGEEKEAVERLGSTPNVVSCLTHCVRVCPIVKLSDGGAVSERM